MKVGTGGAAKVDNGYFPLMKLNQRRDDADLTCLCLGQLRFARGGGDFSRGLD